MSANTVSTKCSMDAVISVLAGALWPSMPQRVSANQHAGQAEYWQMSGADCLQVPHEVLRVIKNCFHGKDQEQLLLLLRLLACKLPTLLLAGKHSLTGRPPFVSAMPDMSVEALQATLDSWAHSRLPLLRKVYKALKSIIAASIMSHIDPATGTNPFFAGVGYTPGNKVQERDLGPEQPVAATEELVASATVHVPEVVAKGLDLQAYLTKRGFATIPAGQDAIKYTSIGISRTSSRSSSAGVSAPVDLYYDAVIVGSGAGGGVTAALLSAAGMKVLVLEKASWVRSKDMSWLESDAHAEMYEKAGFLATHDGSVSILAGSTLGGGTKTNWTASLKPPDHVRQEWATAPHNLPLLGPGSKPFDDALTAVCNRLGVSTTTEMSGPNAKLLQGCKELGLHGEELPRNCLSKKCSAYCNFGCRSGHKQSSDVCWLVDAVRAGAQVLTGVEGHKVLMQKQTAGSKSKKVVGLIAVSSHRITPGATTNALQQHTLVIHAPLVTSSCGSINTPALLLRSGVRVGGNVGKYLRLHPATGVVGVFKPSEQQSAAGQGAVNMYQGVSMGAFSRAAANWNDGGYGAMVSVPAVHPGLLAAIIPDSKPRQLKQLFPDLPNASCCVVFTRDSGSGSVRIDEEGRPVIKYWPCKKTRGHLLDGVSLACRAMVAAGATCIAAPNAMHDWILDVSPDDPLPVRQQQLEQHLKRMRRDGIVKYSMPVLSAHQMGSCRMGASPRSSVVDPAGECWHVSGLYVADASLFPTASGVNPMITVYGLSYLVASGIAQRWKADRKADNSAVRRAVMDVQRHKDQDECKQ